MEETYDKVLTGFHYIICHQKKAFLFCVLDNHEADKFFLIFKTGHDFMRGEAPLLEIPPPAIKSIRASESSIELFFVQNNDLVSGLVRLVISDLSPITARKWLNYFTIAFHNYQLTITQNDPQTDDEEEDKKDGEEEEEEMVITCFRFADVWGEYEDDYDMDFDNEAYNLIDNEYDAGMDRFFNTFDGEEEGMNEEDGRQSMADWERKAFEGQNLSTEELGDEENQKQESSIETKVEPLEVESRNNQEDDTDGPSKSFVDRIRSLTSADQEDGEEEQKPKLEDMVEDEQNKGLLACVPEDSPQSVVFATSVISRYIKTEFHMWIWVREFLWLAFHPVSFPFFLLCRGLFFNSHSLFIINLFLHFFRRKNC